jgi:hypothetical protein
MRPITPKPKPLAIDLQSRPELWQKVTANLGGEDFECNVLYHILTKTELDARRVKETQAVIDKAEDARDRMREAADPAADRDDEPDQYTALDRQLDFLRSMVEELAPEKTAERVAELQARIIDWDIIDGAGKGKDKLPCTPDTVAAVCQYEDLYNALAAGLLIASGDARKKP